MAARRLERRSATTRPVSVKRKAGIGVPFKIELRRGAFRRRTFVESLQPPALHTEELMRRLRRFEPFRKIPAEELSLIALAATVRSYRAGEYVWRRGAMVQHAAFLESGFVKLARPSPDGVPATYGLFGPGDSIGVLAIWAGMRYPTDAIALNHGLEVICVDSDTLRQVSERSLEMAAAVRDELTRFSIAFMTKIHIASAGTVPQRLAALMLHLVDRYGVNRKDFRARVPFPIPREELGNIVGAREETVVRALVSWKRSGWLETRADGFYIKRLDKLREMVAWPPAAASFGSDLAGLTAAAG